jgi:hypothetical protein
MEVRTRVLVFRRVATAHVAALQAHAQMQPRIAHFQALFATLRLGLHLLQVLRNMTASCCTHGDLQAHKSWLLQFEMLPSQHKIQ